MPRRRDDRASKDQRGEKVQGEPDAEVIALKTIVRLAGAGLPKVSDGGKNNYSYADRQ
jgi:hypothetical protein